MPTTTVGETLNMSFSIVDHGRSFSDARRAHRVTLAAMAAEAKTNVVGYPFAAKISAKNTSGVKSGFQLSFIEAHPTISYKRLNMGEVKRISLLEPAQASSDIIVVDCASVMLMTKLSIANAAKKDPAHGAALRDAKKVIQTDQSDRFMDWLDAGLTDAQREATGKKKKKSATRKRSENRGWAAKVVKYCEDLEDAAKALQKKDPAKLTKSLAEIKVAIATFKIAVGVVKA